MEKSLRMVSFDPKLRRKLNESLESSSSVAMKECQLKRAAYGDTLEILAGSRGCKVETSERHFELPSTSGSVDGDSKGTQQVSIEDVNDIALMQLVSVCVKVLFVGEPEKVEPKNTWRVLTKQECIIGDESATIRIVLWQSNVGRLKKDGSYRIVNVTVRVYQGVKYLSVSESSAIEEIDDIGDVADIESNEELTTAAKVIKGYIHAVVSCNHYPSCFNCNAKLTCESDGDEYDIIECVKCQSKMVRGRCKEGTIGRVIVESSEKAYTYRLTVFEDVIKAIVKDIDIEGASLSDKLVCAPELEFTIRDEVVVSAKPV